MHYEGDPTSSDNYCQVCACHIIGCQSYENHLLGYRHAKNLKKLEKGKTVTKVRYVKMDDRAPTLLNVLKNLDGPIIGLDKISEKHRWNSTIIFNCNACGGTFTSNTIAEHILSTKHRITIIGRDNPTYSTQICGMKLTKEIQGSIVESEAVEYEKKHGRGQPEVIAEKSCLDPRELDRYMAKHTESAYNAAQLEGAPGPSTAASAVGSSSDENETEGGIADIDIERDSDMIGVDMKIEIMKNLIDSMKIRFNDKALAKGYVDVLDKFSFFKLLHKVRQLPPVKFEKLVKEAEQDENVTYSEYVEKYAFWYISPDKKSSK